jgi:hypothetical protein
MFERSDDSVLCASPTSPLLNYESREKNESFRVTSVSRSFKLNAVQNPNTPAAQATELMIKKYLNTNNENVVAMPIDAFSRFEASIFDLLNFKKDPIFKSDFNSNDTLRNLYDLDSSDYTTAIVSNMNDLKHQFDFSIPNRPKLTRENMYGRDLKKSQQIKSDEIKRARVITVIANSSHQRPRRAAHLLVSNKIGETFEHVIQIIHNALNKEFGSIKKIFNLNGSEVRFDLKPTLKPKNPCTSQCLRCQTWQIFSMIPEFS